jgi:3-methyl-2-oxobutanoate hydroxymethyltransferase
LFPSDFIISKFVAGKFFIQKQGETMKKTRFDFQKMKDEGEKVVWITAYDYPTAEIAEKAGMDMLLVGDSLGMCVYGYAGTLRVTMEQCLLHCEAVRRAAPNTFIIGDMPFLSYQTSVADAVCNAGRFHKAAEVDAIKLEGGRRVCPQIKAIADGGMLVMGHIGLTPQSSGQLGGFKAQGRTTETALELIADAQAIERAGAFSLLVEAVPPEVCKIIRDTLTIPVYSIGAGVEADGQLMIVSDLLGIFQAFTPKFVKKYANLGIEMEKAFRAYVDEVRQAAFPLPEHTYSMVAGELDKHNSALAAK